MSSAIQVNGVSKKYKNVVALDDISFDVATGELFGLIGPDGAGKSSLYRILATLSRPDKGSAIVCGMDTVADFRKLRSIIGYMPERFSLYPDLTVSENLNFFASLFGVSLKDNFDFIAPVFGQFKRFPDRKAGSLSGGMKQKLALSCALIHRPKILLLDEPTTGVDAVSRGEFWDMLGALKEQGITILVSTSYMDEATRCERISMINKGKILETDTPANLVANLRENLYNAVASDMFRLLSELRLIPSVKTCYTFGATLHIVGDKDFNPVDAVSVLTVKGLKDVRIYPAKGNIEDLFIRLTGDEK